MVWIQILICYIRKWHENTIRESFIIRFQWIRKWIPGMNKKIRKLKGLIHVKKHILASSSTFKYSTDTFIWWLQTDSSANGATLKWMTHIFDYRIFSVTELFLSCRNLFGNLCCTKSKSYVLKIIFIVADKMKEKFYKWKSIRSIVLTTAIVLSINFICIINKVLIRFKNLNPTFQCYIIIIIFIHW